MSDSVFDADGHVEITSYTVMCAVLDELCDDPSGKWDRGEVKKFRTDGRLVCTLEVNQPNDPQNTRGITALVGDHLMKLTPFAFGRIEKMSAAEYAAYLEGLS